MADEKKLDEKKLDEEALESVSGGKVSFTPPVYDPEAKEYTCPVCGETIIDNGINSSRVQCSSCGRWFRFHGSTLVEE